MVTETSRILEGLTGAMAVSTAALEPNADNTLRRSAMRTLRRALVAAAEADDFWADLMARAANPTIDGYLNDGTALREVLADAFVERYAVLLTAGGYKSPPPPEVSDLLSTTWRAISTPRESDVESVSATRTALRNFIQVFDENIAATAGIRTGGWRQLISGRRVLAGVMTLAVASGVSVKTGDDFDVNVGFSVRDRVTVEIEIPKPWDTAATSTITQAVAAQVNGQIEQANEDISLAEKGGWGRPATTPDDAEVDSEKTRSARNASAEIDDELNQMIEERNAEMDRKESTEFRTYKRGL